MTTVICILIIAVFIYLALPNVKCPKCGNNLGKWEKVCPKCKTRNPAHTHPPRPF